MSGSGLRGCPSENVPVTGSPALGVAPGSLTLAVALEESSVSQTTACVFGSEFPAVVQRQLRKALSDGS